MHRVVSAHVKHVLRGAQQRLHPTPRLAMVPKKALSSASAAPEAKVVVDRAVGWWLFGCSGMVCGMVAVGGLTRLTKVRLCARMMWERVGLVCVREVLDMVVCGVAVLVVHV